jgi:cytochrome oxidase Cu insertion factor (SCO1/SenC/PrrC family)
MALTYTPAPRLGSPMPDFDLPAVDAKRLKSAQLTTRPTVIMFICGHCPYVLAIEQRLIDLAHAFQDRVHFVGICSNDWRDHPEDTPEALLRRWQDKRYGFPYLLDATQAVAQAFGAVCTPDIFVYDAQQKLCYRGRLDDAWKNPSAVRRQDLKLALEQLLSNRMPAAEQIPSMGCSIKWREK